MPDSVTRSRRSATPSTAPKIVIHADQAAKHTSAIELGRKQGNEKKYNIKLLRQDYDVIKAAAEIEERSASYFVSYLIYDHIARDVAHMKAVSEDALLLMAATADTATEYDILSTPWLYDLMLDYLVKIVAAVTGNDDADLKPLDAMIAKYRHHNSHHHAVVKLMLGS
jgi:uncharacterized protein (DUF1778 family)